MSDCPACDGELVEINDRYWTHECVECGYEETFSHSYPRIVHEEVEE